MEIALFIQHWCQVFQDGVFNKEARVCQSCIEMLPNITGKISKGVKREEPANGSRASSKTQTAAAQ